MGEKLTIDKLIDMHKAECAAHVYGKECRTLACLKRNWAVNLGQPGAYEFVGCLSHQTVAALEELRQPANANT